MDSAIVYPVSVNGKVRTKIEIPYDTSENNIKQYVMDNGTVRRWINGMDVNKSNRNKRKNDQCGNI